ncbi:hypothetical protein ACP4OV_005691 [Aristida adscensionis]
MEGADGGGRSSRLVAELGRVQELVRQLELQLHAPPGGAATDHCRRLAAQILALTDRSIAIAAARCSPPPSGAPSPLSDAASDQPFGAAAGGVSPKKRKATARWTSQVRVSAAGGAEGPADDGHSWRKYGQKDILGAKHPRGYYRCTHRNSQGCPATKQVQRTDDDPALFDVVYHGDHTCRPAAAAKKQHPPPPPPPHNPHAQSLLDGLAAGLTVTTDCGGGMIAGAPLTPETCAARGAASPWSLASPVGSDSNNGCPGVSPCPVAGGYREWSSDGELQEVVSALAAVSGAHPPSPIDAAAFMPMPEYFGLDASFDILDVADMPGLFLP